MVCCEVTYGMWYYTEVFFVLFSYSGSPKLYRSLSFIECILAGVITELVAASQFEFTTSLKRTFVITNEGTVLNI